ncbi:hypothetical protein [Dokdonella sp.]|uniref:hypothetical protein n=1 Tax=Dokdonella sp. TaxID=2291710 RepID=UPI001AFFC6DC|nr:hypothetical protein [Dokdonella sp.]MBO9661902.1 hypothetical protein [Dokdonella sp.]
MTPRTRNRIGLLLIMALFLAPLIAAYVLNALDWRPGGTRNYGTLIEPPQDLSAARFVFADGRTLQWKDEDWSWTVFALPGPGCAEKCLARIEELRRVRLTLNQNAYRVRVVVLDDTLAPERLASLKPVELARDVDGKLAALRPGGTDEIAVAFADPHGFLALRYPVGYDANLLRKDLARLVKR